MRWAAGLPRETLQDTPRYRHATVSSAVEAHGRGIEKSTGNIPQSGLVFAPLREEKLQEWEGRVTEICGDRFVARLIDLTAGCDSEGEEGDFPIAELSESHRELLRENAVFRWIIGYRYNGGTKERFARVVFRRLPAWSAMELDAAAQSAQKQAKALVWE